MSYGNPHNEYIRGLKRGLERMYDQLDATNDPDLELAVQAIEEKLWKAEEASERWESESARRDAEHRLAIHRANDTLDQY